MGDRIAVIVNFKTCRPYVFLFLTLFFNLNDFFHHTFQNEKYDLWRLTTFQEILSMWDSVNNKSVANRPEEVFI